MTRRSAPAVPLSVAACLRQVAVADTITGTNLSRALHGHRVTAAAMQAHTILFLVAACLTKSLSEVKGQAVAPDMPPYPEKRNTFEHF